jgi:hypothetical protein
MANLDAKLRVTELDFDTIKTNLRAFLKSQSEFSDYNFEGSGLSVLLDVLAYNTHYMGYYMNMMANEMFMDTALTRPSVVSHAKLLGYAPRSRVASQATINLSFQEVSGGSNSALTLPRFTRFVSESKDGVSYIFVNTDQKVTSKEDGYFIFNNVQLKEGQPVGYTFTYDAQVNTKQVFELPDAGIDTTTILVQVQTSAQSSNLETYILAEDATTVSSTSAVYYLEENRNGKYQIYFGDNIIGKSLTDGNIVIVSYVVTSGDAANGIRTFKLQNTVLAGVTPTIDLVSESSSGKLEESIEEIKFNAPKSFIAQNRAVTKNDYINMINKKYPYFDSVIVWGGDEEEPPVYGKIYFSAKPRGNYEISESEVEYVKNSVIQPMSMLTVTPEYVAADYNYVNCVADVIYDPRKTTKTAGEIKTLVYNAILDFAETNLNAFNGSFKLSRLIRAIDDADPSIENNSVKLVLEKRFRPALGVAASYTLNYNIPIKKGTSLEKVFSSPSFTHYDELGTLRTCFIEEVPQSFSGIDEIQILEAGSGYTELPEVVIEGDGTGATARAIIVNGKLKSINVISAGSNYTSAIARIVGGNGSGATAKVVLEGKRGSLRLYYYDNNNIKKTINDQIGEIYYNDGIITLTNFQPITVNDAYGTMTFKASPETTVFSTKRNSILTLDNTDPSSIDVRVSSLVI